MAFLSAAERDTCTAFLRDGYVIKRADDAAALNRIRQFVVACTAHLIGDAEPLRCEGYLDTIAERVTVQELNELRLALIDEFARASWFREAYFACGRELVETVVGNELAMQRGVGISIQLPNDDSSLLPLHSDVWSDDSPFEVVLWIPLVDCFRTKSMFLLPPEADTKWRTRLSEFEHSGVSGLFSAVESELHWLEVPYGNVLVFTHTLMHGNAINLERSARWSMNVRFKSLFTPYSEKQLGEFFEPIVIRPASRIGMLYELPGGFDVR